MVSVYLQEFCHSLPVAYRGSWMPRGQRGSWMPINENKFQFISKKFLTIIFSFFTISHNFTYSFILRKLLWKTSLGCPLILDAWGCRLFKHLPTLFVRKLRRWMPPRLASARHCSLP